MGIRPKKRTLLIALTTATAGVLLASVFLRRPPARVSGQIGMSSLAPVAIVSQPTSPLQIVSVTPVTPQAPPGMRAEAVADLRAYSVGLKNVTSQDAILYALQLTSANVAQKAAPAGGKFAERYAAGPGNPALAAGQTKFDVVNISWRAGELAIRIDVVLLEDGTAYGTNTSRAIDEFQENISTRQVLGHTILSTLQTQGPEATERLLKEQVTYLDAQVAKYMSPNWVD